MNIREEPENENSIHSGTTGSKARLLRTAIFSQQGQETGLQDMRKHFARDG